MLISFTYALGFMHMCEAMATANSVIIVFYGFKSLNSDEVCNVKR